MGQVKVSDFYNGVAESYNKIYSLDGKMSYKNGISDYFRLQIVLRILAQNRAQRVFEVGVGDGTPLEHMYKMGLEVAGIDIADGMVKEATKRLVKAGLDSPQIWQADVSNAVELANSIMIEPSDAIIALGVMPHVEKDVLALQNMRTLVKTGGKILVEFRNKLFSLFTFNRYTYEFITEDLLPNASDETKEAVTNCIKDKLRMDLPPIRDKNNEGSGPGYDLIRAKFHIPFEIPGLLEEAGFANAKFHWYHFHAAQPMLTDELGEAFDNDSMAMEHELANDWRGYFLCSAVLVEADAV